MSRQKAVLMLDPNRRSEQLAFITERVENIHEFGNFLWVSITEEQATRFAQQGILVQFQETADLIDLPAVMFDPAAGEPNPPPELTATPPTDDQTAYYLVQFFAPAETEWVSAIAELGGIYVQDLPTHVAVFRLTAVQVPQVREWTPVTWVGQYHPAYALSYILAGRDEPFSANNLQDLRVDPSRIVPTETGTLEILFFEDVTSETVRPSIEAAGATVLADTGYSLVVNITPEQVPELLRVPGVRAVERYFPPEFGNQRAGAIAAVNQVRNFGNIDFLVNLDGTGEIAGVIDSGFDAGGFPPAPAPVAPPPVHADLAGRIEFNNLHVAAAPANTADNVPHGTHVAGSIAGNGSQSGGTIRGMAPACRVIFHSAQNPALGILDFRRFLTGLVAAHNRGARVHSNSWGRVGVATLVTNNQYNATVSEVIDQFAFFNSESLVLFLSHNFEADANGNGVLDMNRLPPESVAKNILCIGACENVTGTSNDGDNRSYRNIPGIGPYNHPNFNFLGGPAIVPGNFPISDNADQIALFSDRGRVADPARPPAQRRIKPDLVTPGTNIISIGPLAMLPFAAGNPRRPNTAPNAFYYVDTGTSMATPIAAGTAVLTRQYYRSLFGQLRRPLLLERVEQLLARTAITSHRNGVVMAWIRRDTAAGQNHIVAGIYSRSSARRGENALVRQGNIVLLQTNVGDRPAPMLARHGDNTLLLHRASDNTLRLSLYNPALTPVNTFGTNGTVTITPASRSEDLRSPALCVHGNEVAVVWHQTGTDNLLFQRYRADTGATIGTTQTLGSATATSPHPYILHKNARYAVVWVYRDGTNYKLQMRLIDNAGTPVGTQPTTLVTQSEEIRDPCLSDTLSAGFLVVWVSTTSAATGDEIYRLFVDQNLSSVGSASVITPAPTPISGGPLPLPPKGIRRPLVAIHPSIFTGYVLAWEDDTQLVRDNTGAWQRRYDVYLTFLGLNGTLDGRINGNRLRISDTPLDTSGFACLTNSEDSFLVWQSNDEINSDILGIYAIKVTSQGAFQAQVDPNTPLLNSGRYVRHVLHRHNDPTLAAVAMVWAGGDYFLLRAIPDRLSSTLHLVRTNADGLPDPTFGGVGSREIDLDIGHDRITLYWAETHLVAAHTFGLSGKVILLDGDGNRVNTFGTNGTRDLGELAAPTISPQLGHTGSGNTFQVLMVYGRFGNPQPTIRYAVLDRTGNPVTGPRDLVPASGTARQGWFHFVASDTPNHSIAAWHLRVGSNFTVQINRFRLNGQAQHGTPIQLTALVGDSQNAVIAPRPVLFGLEFPAAPNAALRRRRREYGVAWEYRPNPANPGDPALPSQIRFSRLNRDGTVGAVRDVEVVRSATHNATDPQLVWHTDGYGLAWLEQPLAGGNRTLFFVALDENGVRINLAAVIVVGGAVVPVPNHQISDAAADVKRFHLVWNGRTFRISWTEEQGGELRHMQSAIATPRQAGVAGYDQPYHHPTSALIRATLINGATNIRRTALPNLSDDPNDGYGWGRINLRQSLAPSPPVTFHVRDDSSVASGHTVRYDFYLPPNTRLLRATLSWTDPPGDRLVNNLNLRIVTPAVGASPSRTYVGNRWQAGGSPNSQFSDPLPVPPPPNPFETIHNVEQIVILDPPEGIYVVEVVGGSFNSSEFQQFPGQPFALVCVGSGTEVRFGGLPAAGVIPFY